MVPRRWLGLAQAIFRHETEEFEQELCPGQRGDATGVEGRRDFHQVGPDNIQPTQTVQEAFGFVGAEPPDSGRSRAGSEGRVEGIDVELI